ncbi:MAG: hypothetical protein JXN64_06740 [Spirochaetes bacterium]|nr:hypothetical protein [Spirochaetota bacterium]
MTAAENTIGTSEQKNLYILKGRFKSNSLNFYGLFLFIFNTRHEITVNHILVSTYSSAYDMEPHFAWEKYEEFIVNSKWKGNYNPNMTASIENFFKQITTDGYNGQKEILYEYIKNYEYDNVDSFMFDIINRIIHDKNLIIETGIQESSEIEFRETKSNKSQKKEKESEQIAKKIASEEGVTLIIQLILAPVSGKPIFELKIGDIIMCKIVPNTDRANYFIDLLDLRVENLIKPVPCKVIDIKSEGKGQPLEILTEIGPGIYGKCVEDERQVKLRMYDPAVDERITKKNIQEIQKETEKTSFISEKISNLKKFNFLKLLYIIIGVFVIIGLLIILYYLLIL